MEGKIQKKVFMLRAKEGTLISDIDTDQIFHNKYLAIVDIAKMGQYAFDNLQGYEDFPKKAEPDMVIIAGENFGSGSSRQQAVDCFTALGMYGVGAQSFGAIYKRNAINSGFPVIEIISLDDSSLETGDMVEFDFDAGIISRNGAQIGKFRKFSSVQKELIEKKGLLNSL